MQQETPHFKQEEAPYTKRELDHFLQELNQHLTHQDEALVRIENQTTKTNGRVTKLEQWRSVLIWGFGGILMVCTEVVKEIIKIYYKVG